MSLLLNSDSATFRAAFDSFARRATDAGMVLFYFAGHGLRADGVNRLAPIDLALDDPGTAATAGRGARAAPGAARHRHAPGGHRAGRGPPIRPASPIVARAWPPARRARSRPRGAGGHGHAARQPVPAAGRRISPSSWATRSPSPASRWSRPCRISPPASAAPATGVRPRGSARACPSRCSCDPFRPDDGRISPGSRRCRRRSRRSCSISGAARGRGSTRRCSPAISARAGPAAETDTAIAGRTARDPGRHRDRHARREPRDRRRHRRAALFLRVYRGGGGPPAAPPETTPPRPPRARPRVRRRDGRAIGPDRRPQTRWR